MRVKQMDKLARQTRQNLWQSYLLFLSEQKNRQIVFYGIIVSVFAFAYILNYLEPLFQDDWEYSFMWGSHTERLTRFVDIFRSQYLHYMTWGGRTIAHTVLQALLLLGKNWSDALNAIAFTFFIVIVYKISNLCSATKYNIGLLVSIILLAWLLLPLGSAAFWLTGSCNYLWTTTIVLSFFYPFCKYYIKQSDSRPIMKTILFPFWGIIAGWSNESLAVSAISFLAIIFLVLKIEKRTIPSWLISAALGVTVGASLLLLAPGNYIRLKEVIIEEAVPSSFTARLAKGIYSVFCYLFFVGIKPAMIYSIGYLIYKNNKKDGIEKQKKLSFIFVAVCLVATFSMSASPTFPERVWFAMISFAIIGFGLLYANINFSNLRFGSIKNVFLIFGTFVVLGQYYQSARATHAINEVYKEREKILLSEKKRGNYDIVFPTELKNDATNFTYIKDLSKDPSSDLNQLYSSYHDVKSVRVK